MAEGLSQADWQTWGPDTPVIDAAIAQWHDRLAAAEAIIAAQGDAVEALRRRLLLCRCRGTGAVFMECHDDQCRNPEHAGWVECGCQPDRTVVEIADAAKSADPDR